jgi:hypothetical protein
MSKNSRRSTAAQWAGPKAEHEIVLPSGACVLIRIPDLPALIETGEIPQNLLDAALGVARKPDSVPTKELIVQQREFTDKLVELTVLDPKVTPEMLDHKTGIPYEDKEMIVEIATRQRDLDAEGNHIGGLDKSSKWRTFRGLGGLYTDVEGLPGS